MGERYTFPPESYISILLIFFSICVSIQAQSIPGFVSIDCGGSSHSDAVTRFQWEGDGNYTSTGENGTVPITVDPTLDNSEALTTFRYFPDGRSKYCYDLPTASNVSFLLRAMFLQGSAVELTLPISFNVAINGTTWFSVDYNIGDSSNTLASPIVQEGIFFSPGTTTHFCLVTGTGVPFISSLELRQLDPDGLMYIFQNKTTQYLSNLLRWNCGAPPGSPTVRYPDDTFDRLWYNPGNLSGVSIGSGTPDTYTDSGVNSVPPTVMKDAWVYDTPSTFGISFELDSSITELYIAAYFEEIISSASTGDRLFQVELNEDPSSIANVTTPQGNVLLAWWNPYLSDELNMTLTSFNNSTLGPILNAFEAYSIFPFNDSATATQDVDALAALQVSFSLTDWQGDPCYPVSWDWVNCTGDVPGRVEKLWLSSMGINAAIPSNISTLTALTQIHLDNNSLYGSIPDSLASLPHLTFLSLNNNNLSGDVPADLKAKLGSNFIYYGNTLLGNSSGNSTTNTKSTKVGVTIGAAIGGAAALVILVSLFLWCLCSSKKIRPNHEKLERGISDMETASRKSFELKNETPRTAYVEGKVLFLETASRGSFQVKSNDTPRTPYVKGKVSYETVQSATNNFNTKIGEGSYGFVYHGWLNNREVAVKMNNIGSKQGQQEFTTEVDILTRVHHRNLVSLIAYCDEGNELILIYEFQANGTLREWLYGDDDEKVQATLDWKRRLQICLDGAKGLEYLHKGCDPPIIHRDVKSNNILLDQGMTAKVADFGLSKSTAYEKSSGFSTKVKGTPGYLDPEYHQLGRLTPKSDVFSYGVVLAEVITGHPPFKIDSEGGATILVEIVERMVKTNDIDALADPSLQGAYNPESMWKMAELILACVNPVGALRPDFTQVVSAINNAIEFENLTFTAHSPVSIPSSSFSLQSDPYQSFP